MAVSKVGIGNTGFTAYSFETAVVPDAIIQRLLLLQQSGQPSLPFLHDLI